MNARKTPILLRKAPMTRGIVALHRYRWDGDKIISATNGKQDVTADFDVLMLDELFGRFDDPDESVDSGLLTSALDGVARGMELNDDEREAIAVFRERLVAVIERHNSTGHGAA